MCIFTTSLTVAGITVSALTANIMAGIAAAGTIAGVAGSVVSGISSYQQGKQQQAMYNYQAEVEKQNAKIAQDNAALERQQGIEESRLQRMKTAKTIGAQQAAMAANGIDVTQGTPLDIIQDTATIGELDALQTRYNYESKAINYEQQAANFQNQSNLDIIAGKNAASAGRINSLAYGLNGLSKAGDVATKWFGFGSLGSSAASSGTQLVSGGIKGDNIRFA